MSRPLRIEFPHALYHVTSRGDRREAIYADDADREAWLDVLDHVCRRFNWVVQAYCLMGNHYHLMLQTPDANLSAGMRQLNGVYTQRANQRHGRVGHVFQGRYKAVLVDRATHWLELARYVVLNPVRAGMVPDVRAWPWSSFAATAGLAGVPDWLDVQGLLAAFGPQRDRAVQQYVDHVRAGVGLPSIWGQLKHELYLGGDEFVAQMQRLAEAPRRHAPEVPRAQRRAPAAPLSSFVALRLPRHAAMSRAFATGAYSLAEIARAFDVHYSTVSRAVVRMPAPDSGDKTRAAPARASRSPAPR